MRPFRLLLLSVFLPTLLQAQRFGGIPPGKWGQVNTGEVRVIFPIGMDSIAQRVATIAQELQHDSSYRQRLQKINLVLQPYTTISNAYVSLAPYRSEFYLMAPQNAFELGGISWADNLVVHEWRHVQQYNYFNRGLARVASFFLGQEGRALLNAAAVPDWYFEGDAILGETRTTSQGRGRLPLAFSGYKSLFHGGRDYSYMKLRNGSLKHFIPDHYDLGYLLVAYGAEKYGRDFWSKVTRDASAFRPLFYPLQGAIKKYSGIPYRQFVSDAFAWYQEQWKQEQLPAVEWLSGEKDYRADYLFPYADGQDIIAVKKSTKSNPAFVRIAADGSEERLAAQDITLDHYYSYNNGRIVYSAYSPDPRWTNREYNNIVLLETGSGKRTKLTTKSRYFSPDISNDGQHIVTVEMLPGGESKLLLLDDSGTELRTIAASRDEVFSYPKFSVDGNTVYAVVRNTRGQMSLRAYFIGREQMQKSVMPFGNYIIGFPVVNGDTISFTATAGKSDAAYAWIASKEKLYKLATYPSGLYQPVLAGGNVIASAVTASGYRLARLHANWEEVTAPARLRDIYVDKALESAISLNKIPTRRQAYTKYGKLSHPFNFHSWRPYYDQPEYSFTVYGQNVLNTVSTELAYIYNENENSHSASGSLVYGGTFLQPFIGIEQTWERKFYHRPDTVVSFKELEWQAGLRLPLELTGGRMFRFMTLSGSFHSTDITVTGRFKDLFSGNDIQYLQGRLSFSSQLQKASQHILPRFAYSVLVQGRNALNREAKQFLGSANLYLPGLLRTHNIVLSAAYQGRDTMPNYRYTNNFPFSRGYGGGPDIERMWKLGANYHFPLLHPDWGFAHLVYFLRLRLNAFYDVTRVERLRTGRLTDLASAGGELYFDTRWWNQLPVTFGIRYSRLMNGEALGLGPNQWEFIVPVGLIR